MQLRPFLKMNYKITLGCTRCKLSSAALPLLLSSAHQHHDTVLIKI